MLIYDRRGLSQSNEEIDSIYSLTKYQKHLRDTIVYRLGVAVKYCSPYSRDTGVRLQVMSAKFFTVQLFIPPKYNTLHTVAYAGL